MLMMIFKNNTCTCPSFFKKYICKHIIGIAIRTIPEIRKSIPLAAKNLPLTSKRKTGRPALAKKALVRQPFVSILRADDEVLDLNDEIDDDIDYDAETDEVLNHNYEVDDNQRDFQNAYDCGIDLNEQQNIINLIGSLDTESLSSVNTQSTTSTATDEEQTYFELQPGTRSRLYFSQMTDNQIISSNIQSSISSFPSLAPSISEIISSTVIDKDNTLVDKTITNLPNIPKSILIAKPKVIQDSCHKKRGRKPMTDEGRKERE